MKKLLLAALATAAILSIIMTVQTQPHNSTTFHVTLANPKLYNNGIFSQNVTIQKGDYEFKFVPNGDSPQTLTVSLKGKSINYTENFNLQGTSHDTGISTYYTWDYIGTKDIEVSEDQLVNITIYPHGNTLGSVSLDLNAK